MKIFAIFSQFSTRPPQGSTRRVEIVCGHSIFYVIPNQAKGFTRHPEAAHEPRGISPFVVTHSLRWDSSCSRGAPPLTSPHWGSCAASSKCSCKQVFLLASDGMTEERGHAPNFAPLGLVRRRRSRFLPAMAKTSVRRARTPHRGDAHNARLTLPCTGRARIGAKITRVRKVSFRQRPTFAHTCAFAERCSGAQL